MGLVKVVATHGRPYYHYSDQAILALRVGDAMRFHAEVGPHSRFGWSHPGPALFYLLAPVYSLSGTNPRSLLPGSLLINGVCIVATLLVVHRFVGEWSATPSGTGFWVVGSGGESDLNPACVARASQADGA